MGRIVDDFITEQELKNSERDRIGKEIRNKKDTIKNLQKDINNLQTIYKQIDEPKIDYEKLKGKLCWFWNDENEMVINRFKNKYRSNGKWVYITMSNSLWRNCRPVTKEEIEGLLYEQKNKNYISYIDWDRISKIYRWVAFEKDGKVYAFVSEPVIKDEEWKCSGALCNKIDITRLFINYNKDWARPYWKDSLIKRPGT